MDKKEYEEQLFKSIISSLEAHGAGELITSVIVSGSFGRGEPTYTSDENGNTVLKSDIEIALVYKGRGKSKRVKQLVDEVSAEFEEELNLMPLTEKRVKKAYNFNYSFFVPKYKTIFTYDLFNGSYTLWGEDYIGEKSLKLSQCDIYEAKRLIANRIGELIYICEKAEQGEYLKKQWKGKVVLAIASAYLICDGKYVSGYRGQYDKIIESSEQICKALGNNFLTEYKKSFAFLRDGGQIYETDDALLRGFVKSINEYFKAKKINKPRVNSLSRYVKYLLKYLKVGMGYGIFGFEDKIIQTLIEQYQCGDGDIVRTARVWHEVLH